jgi:tRNA A-37 threonylcarbamoyl transferase component Bud32
MRVPAELERHRIKTTGGNPVFRVQIEDHTIFLKLYMPKLPRLKTAWRRFLGSSGIRQPVEYWSPKERRRFEAETLDLWRSLGYSVPAVVDIPFPGLSSSPFLTTEFIQGTTLRELLKDGSIPSTAQLEKLAILFSEMNERHHTAFAKNDNRLFHIDANTRNILFADRRLFHVDFEMGRPWESVIECASRETLKCLVTLFEDSPASLREPIAKVFRNCYRQDHVYGLIEARVRGRALQRLHKWRNSYKKRKNPSKVTLYDIVSLLSPQKAALE